MLAKIHQASNLPLKEKNLVWRFEDHESEYIHIDKTSDPTDAMLSEEIRHDEKNSQSKTLENSYNISYPLSPNNIFLWRKLTNTDASH